MQLKLRHIAWASLKRRKGRFVFLLIAVILGIGTVVALTSLAAVMRAEVGDELDRFGANVIITPKTRSLDVAYGSLALGGVPLDSRQLSVDDARRVRTIANRRNISAVAPKLLGSIEIDQQRVLIIGADFRQERRIKPWWNVDGRVPDNPDEILIGTEAARALDRRIGATVTLDGRSRIVVGLIAPTGSLDDGAIFADLTLVQRVLDQPGAVSFIEVSALCRGCPIDDIVAQIAAVIPTARVAPVRQAVAARERAVMQFTRFGYAVSAIVLLVGGLVVLTTMMAAVTDRTQEIGILRAIGFRQTQVARVILLEVLSVTLLGGLLGWAAGMFAARSLGPSLAQTTTPIPLDPQMAGIAIALALLLGAGGGTYPALRAAHLDPSQALRHT